MQRELNTKFKSLVKFSEVKHEDCMKSIKLFTEKIITFKSKSKEKLKLLPND